MATREKREMYMFRTLSPRLTADEREFVKTGIELDALIQSSKIRRRKII
jgi:hypothetical protein